MTSRLSLIALIGGLLSACAQTEAPTAPLIGLANPATQFCVAQGGKHLSRSAPTGTVGMCALPDGQVIEEWAYFRQHQPPK